MKNIHNIVQSHTNAQEGNILQELMVVWLAQGPPFTRNVDVTKSFFFFFTQCTAVLEWMVLMCHTIPCKDKMFFFKKKKKQSSYYLWPSFQMNKNPSWQSCIFKIKIERIDPANVLIVICSCEMYFYLFHYKAVQLFFL